MSRGIFVRGLGEVAAAWDDVTNLLHIVDEMRFGMDVFARTGHGMPGGDLDGEACL